MPRTVHVFTHTRSGNLEALLVERLEAFCRGRHALTPRIAADGARRTEMLFVTLVDGDCRLLEPIALPVDESGFLARRDWLIEELPASGIVDARARFLRRQMARTHTWRPAPALIARATALAGASDPDRADEGQQA